MKRYFYALSTARFTEPTWIVRDKQVVVADGEGTRRSKAVASTAEEIIAKQLTDMLNGEVVSSAEVEQANGVLRREVERVRSERSTACSQRDDARQVGLRLNRIIESYQNRYLDQVERIAELERQLKAKDEGMIVSEHRDDRPWGGRLTGTVMQPSERPATSGPHASVANRLTNLENAVWPNVKT